MTPSDKERRHLVASITTGLLAMHSNGHRVVTHQQLIAKAFCIYDELIRQDEVREKAIWDAELLRSAQAKPC